MEARVINRDYVTPALNDITSQKPKSFWLENLEKEMVGCAPILYLDEVFSDPQVQARDMEIQMNLPGFDDSVSLIGSPMKFSRTKVDYRMPPPRVGEHTEQVLLNGGFSMDEIANLHDLGAIDNAKFEVPGVERPLAPKKERVQLGPKTTGKSWRRMRSVSVPAGMGDSDPLMFDEGASVGGKGGDMQAMIEEEE